MRRASRLLLPAALVAMAAGCSADPRLGYSAASIYPAEVRTVALPIFANDTFHRDLEFALADALVKEIESRTPYKAVPESRADSVILGTIRKAELTQLSKSRSTGLAEEVIVSVTIDFEWRDLRTNAPIVQHKDFAGYGLFVPNPPTSDSIELGRFSVVQLLARDIVSEMQAEW